MERCKVFLSVLKCKKGGKTVCRNKMWPVATSRIVPGLVFKWLSFFSPLHAPIGFIRIIQKDWFRNDEFHERVMSEQPVNLVLPSLFASVLR